MPEIRLYDLGRERLHALLKAAGDPEGASLLIPDLQRPYVWKPTDVVTLLDSLLRGWPFGTLLLWSIGRIKEEGDERILPARPFWRRVDRTDDPKEARDVPRAGRGAEFRMVLDGQQRIQSLLLATQGDDSGFRLLDSEWDQDAGERPRANASKYWTWGQLCLDTDAFLAAVRAPPHSVMQIDYRQVLKWVVYSTDQGESPNRPPGYQAPVQRYRQGHHIRFSKLWQLAREQWSAEGVYREKLETLLQQHDVPTDVHVELRDRLAELVSVIGDLKDTEVSYLSVRPPASDADEGERQQYDDAVVSIFTRLNTGGKKLTEQEVLFAWIKRKWNSALTGHVNADKCFEGLQGVLETEAVELSIDDLVRGVAAVWSALANDGVLLTERQFRRGADLGAVAPWMAERWTRITDSAVASARILATLGLEQGRHFDSLNSVYTFWAWRFVALEWAKQKAGKELPREAVARAVEDHSRRLLSRWMLIPQWAGRWQDARTFPGYVRDLGLLWKDISATADWELAIARWAACMDSWIRDARDDAARFVTNVHAERRNTVRRYYSLLWTWQNLDPQRSRLAQINLTMKGRGVIETDVDHVVSYNQWETEFTGALALGETIDGIKDGANSIGNCLLLAKNFNISKREKPLKELLDNVYEFRWNEELLTDFCEALCIDETMLNATGRPLTEVRAAVSARAERIRGDLLHFVRGEQDLLEVDADAPPQAGLWNATWTISTVDNKSGVKWTGTMDLKQVGDRLAGTYSEGGVIEATVYRDVVEGQWSDPEDNGGFRWSLAEGGRSFDGTWGRKSHKKGRGTWSGTRVVSNG